jgi:N-acetylglucosaminyldiphosphoundecaprenol N-acetyl-beta-D-mannosaminyltransferase
VDGFGLVLAARLFGQRVDRISGADTVGQLLKEGDRKKWTVGIVGARRGDAIEIEQLFNRLKEKYPLINFINLDNSENLKFEIVFACQGMKKQEEWIWQNRDRIKANVFMGVGGSLDFITGFSQRAPLILRQIGLEWLWRGLQRPSHFKRIWKATFVFGSLVLREKLGLIFRLDTK